MINEVNGLPTHILLVHAVVVLIPLAALLTVLAAVWPAARRRLGIFTPLAALAALIVVPITTQAGEWLLARVHQTPLIEEHVRLGDTMLWFAIALFVVALIAWGLPTAVVKSTGRPPAPWLGVVIAILAVVVAAAATVQVVRVGEAGSRAVWEGSFCPDPVNAEGTCPAA
jgi:hypothetical protein